ncbi:MAG TPA: hypothetical protein VLM42_07035 [Bryobacteraceae bacterium]|nr:hypothetical protein [Bryobacteraceae bacterium]
METFRSALLVLGDAAGFPNEPEVCAAAQEQVALERTKCEFLLKALKSAPVRPTSRSGVDGGAFALTS